MKLIYIFIISIGLSFLLLHFWIKYKILTERSNKFLEHMKEATGTPSSFGVVFPIFMILLLLVIKHSTPLYIMCGTTAVMCLVGLYDDLKKKQDGAGLHEDVIFYSQVAVSLVPIVWNMYYHKTYFLLPFCNLQINLPYLYMPIACFIFTGTINGANITDGFNGGLASCSLIMLLGLILYYFLSLHFHTMFIFSYNMFNILQMVIMFFGLLMTFFIFNIRGKVFMGNAGSMFIGSFFATFVLLNKCELLMAPLGLVWLVETSSVIIQRTLWKYWKRRLWKFTPIHHHFQLSHYNNHSIVLMTIVTAAIGVTVFLYGIF